ncbi:MAG: PEGA domain-containing protein [Myxococcales bacterium]
MSWFAVKLGMVAVGLWGAVAVFVILPARAADEAAPDAELQAAKAEFETAQTLFIKDKYDEAAGHFLGAYARKPFPAFLFNAAVSYEKAHRLDQAGEFFQKYLEQAPTASDAATVKVRIDAIRTILAPPTPAAPSPMGPGTSDPAAAAGSNGAPGAAPAVAAPVALPVALPVLPSIETKGLVVIDSKPPGATIYLNNKTKGVFGKTPWQGSLESKPVKLILEAKGFKPEERNIAPRSDKLVDVYIALSEEHFLGWVEIVANVPGADVFIDSKEIGAIGRTPFTGHLKPGKHALFVEKMGYKPVRQNIDVLPGTATQHTIKLDKGDNGWLNVAGRGAYGATVSIDKKHACNAPCRSELTPGPHRVVVMKRGYEDYDAEVRVDRSAETTLEVQWSARPSRRGAWTSTALAAAFVGAGLYVGHLSNANRDGLRSDIDAGMSIDSNDPRYSRGKWEAIGADAAYAVGGLFAISAVVSFLSHAPDSTAGLDQRTIGLAPTVSPGGAAGLGAWGRF